MSGKEQRAKSEVISDARSWIAPIGLVRTRLHVQRRDIAPFVPLQRAGRQKQSASFEELDVLVVQPEKERGNHEYGKQNEKKNSPPGEHYVTADGTPVGGMADTLTTMGTVSLRSVLHYHGYIINPAVCAKTTPRKRHTQPSRLVHIERPAVRFGPEIRARGIL
jgi:hypothetical protein